MWISFVEGEEWRNSGRIFEIVPCCPKCGKSKVSIILYGLPAYSEEMQKDIDEGRIFLAGCMVEDSIPKYTIYAVLLLNLHINSSV